MSIPRRIAILLALLTSLASCLGAVRHATRHTPATLPYTLNLAPGDVYVHAGERSMNGTESYQHLTMGEGDEVIGSIGRLRSVILPGDSSAVEVLQQSRLRASSFSGKPGLSVIQGETRVGRASSGDGERFDLVINREGGPLGTEVAVRQVSPQTKIESVKVIQHSSSHGKVTKAHNSVHHPVLKHHHHRRRHSGHLHSGSHKGGVMHITAHPISAAH